MLLDAFDVPGSKFRALTHAMQALWPSSPPQEMLFKLDLNSFYDNLGFGGLF
jgi:hypothetical protein